MPIPHPIPHPSRHGFGHIFKVFFAANLIRPENTHSDIALSRPIKPNLAMLHNIREL